MNQRAFSAVLHREVLRGRQAMLWFTGIGIGLMVLAVVVDREVAVGLSTIGILIAVVSVLAPPGNLRQDKALGYLEFDRVLPIAHRALAAARLLGASLRITPVMILCLPLVIAIDRGHPFTAIRAALAIGVPLSAWLLCTGLMWALMAVNIRWNLRRLWWVPMTIYLGPNVLISVLPASAKAAIVARLGDLFAPIGVFVATPLGVVSLLVVMLALPLALFWGAISLFASGLERYTYDGAAAIPTLGAPPRRELAALGRGATLAVTRYCIRLATEQSRRRFALLGVFVAVLILGSREMKIYAQTYVRALAVMIPGGIALQLSLGRTRGTLESVQQLPHPSRTIGLGYLLGVAMLAAPGAAVWVLARAVTGTPPTFANVLSLWAWMVGWSWLASVSVLWLTMRRTMLLALVPIVAGATWFVFVGPARFGASAAAAFIAFRSSRAGAGPAFSLAISLLMVAIGLPLFARGLDEYEYAPARPRSIFARLGAALGRASARRLSRA